MKDPQRTREGRPLAARFFFLIVAIFRGAREGVRAGKAGGVPRIPAKPALPKTRFLPDSSPLPVVDYGKAAFHHLAATTAASARTCSLIAAGASTSALRPPPRIHGATSSSPRGRSEGVSA